MVGWLIGGMDGWMVGWLVSWLVSAFSPVNHKGFISGLKETFIKRYIAERASKAELRPEEQSEKAESCRERERGTSFKSKK